MRRFVPLFLATLLLGPVFPVPAVSDLAPAPDDLEHNRRLLERDRADPDHYARLLRDLRVFQALPPDRQERMRQFDRDLHEEEPAAQQRLWEVLERYVDWEGRLPEADRRRIDDAADRAQRLRVVKDLREKEWAARLPRAEREDLDAVPPSMRARRIAVLRADERLRRKEWRDWADGPKARPDVSPRPNRPARLGDFQDPIQVFVKDRLAPALKEADRTRLHEAEGKWPDYALTLLDLAGKYNLSPPGAGAPGPREVWADARAAAGLPFVPKQVLRGFAKELTPNDRAGLHLRSADEAEKWEILKEEYFRRNPQELERWRRLEKKTRDGGKT